MARQNSTWPQKHSAELRFQRRWKMRVTTGINNEDNKLLELPPQFHPNTRDHGDLLVPTQILPTKITKAQR
eukprot:15167892-Ditylum_brightwellii.AAC.1